MGGRVRTLLRLCVAAGAVGLALSALSGCSRLRTAPVSVVVHFSIHATAAQREAVHDGCGGIPNISAEPMPTADNFAVNRVDGVRFDVTNAGNGDKAKLYKCISKFPGVQGYKLNDPNFQD